MSIPKDFVVPPGVTIPRNDHNNVPRPIRPMAESDFYRHFHSHGPARISSFHQVRDAPGFEVDPDSWALQHLWVYWYANCGLGLLISYQYEPVGVPYTQAEQVFRPHYFYIGCDHKWKSTYKSKGPHDHWNEYTCEHCGAVDKYDSSG